MISFDMVREGECSISYSIASLLTSLKLGVHEKINITHWPFNILEDDFRKKFQDKIKSNDLNRFEKIAISVFVWSELIVKELLEYINFINYKGMIILGGRQIIGEEDSLTSDYPTCDIFIVGYGEKRIQEAICNNNKNNIPIFLYESCKDMNIPSPYLTSGLIVKKKQKMVRMETKRGCLYSCGFCAHRIFNDNKTYDFSCDRVMAELNLFKKKNVGKINVIDPVFNAGENYLNILGHIYNKEIKSQISLQSRFEQIKGEEGARFIDLCGKLNVVLEFGVQSLVEKEYKIINRKNDIDNIERIINILNNKRIDYEVSLIYGLPEQSVATLRETIGRLRLMGCKKLKMHPLMLLKGTDLYKNKKELGLKEKIFENNYNIPLVVESPSFSEIEWREMKRIAEQTEKENQ